MPTTNRLSSGLCSILGFWFTRKAAVFLRKTRVLAISLILYYFWSFLSSA